MQNVVSYREVGGRLFSEGTSTTTTEFSGSFTTGHGLESVEAPEGVSKGGGGAGVAQRAQRSQRSDSYMRAASREWLRRRKAQMLLPPFRYQPLLSALDSILQ
jgi:hypothetical protein